MGSNLEGEAEEIWYTEEATRPEAEIGVMWPGGQQPPEAIGGEDQGLRQEHEPASTLTAVQ